MTRVRNIQIGRRREGGEVEEEEAGALGLRRG